MSCFWILVLFFGLQNNHGCCYERRENHTCGCNERRENQSCGCNERREERCEERCSERRNDHDCDCGCGCNDTFIQTRNYTNFQSHGTCGCEES